MPFSLGHYVGRYCTPENLAELPASDPIAELSATELDAAAPQAAPEAARMLRCLNAKMQRGGAPLKVVMFGTSVTAGNRCNARHGTNYPQLLAQLLSRRYPAANVTLSVYSYPGASPVFMRSCLGTLLPQAEADADLLVVEMTDNLAKSAAGAGMELELILSALRRRSPRAAVLLLAPVDQTCVRGLKRMKPFQHVPATRDGTRQVLARCYGNATPAQAFEAIAGAHGLAHVSQRHALRDRLFGAPDDATRLIGKLVHDQAHPGRRGHLQLAVALEHAIVRHAAPAPSLRSAPTTAAAMTTTTTTRGADGRPATSSAPDHAQCAEEPLAAPPWREASNVFAPRRESDDRAGDQVCALGRAIDPFVTRADGWSFVVERSKQGLPKPGYVATAAGASLDLCFKPRQPPDDALERAACKDGSNGGRRGGGGGGCGGRGGEGEGDARVASLQYAWSLSYLMSYAHMGRVRGECVRGGACSCGERIFDAHWKRQVSVPHVSRLMLKYRYKRGGSGGNGGGGGGAGGWVARGAAERGCPCTIRLTVLNGTSSGENKFKLVALMSGFYTGTIVGDAVTWAANFGIM